MCWNLDRLQIALRGACHALFVLLLIVLSIPANAQNCASPVNLFTNGSFDAGLTGFAAAGRWRTNAASGAIFATRAPVENPAAAPSGQDAAAYPVESTNAFAVNQSDFANDTLTHAVVPGSYVAYFSGQIHLWFDMGWRQAGAATTFAATLSVSVNGTTFMTITTVAGNNPGDAKSTLSNGATLGPNTPSAYTNTGGGGSLSQWNTIRLIVPYSGATTPIVSFRMTGGTGVFDDFAIDRVYVPFCQVVSGLSVIKSSTVVSDPVNGTTNPKMIPGAVVRYCVQITNPTGNPVAEGVVLSDPIPAAQATAVAGSVRVNGTALGVVCNADGTSGGTISANNVSAPLADLPAGSTATAYFDVILN